jgi:signal transduction histidine kinase
VGHESAGRIAEVETRYQVAQKDNELARKDKALLKTQLEIASQQKRQYLWVGGTSLCILILLGLLRQKRYKTKLNRLKDTIAGEEKERRRMAQELHDGIVSRLSIIKMNFSALPQQYQYLNDTTHFQEVVEQLEQSITELRTTSHNLLPEILKKAGLCESIRIYCDKIGKVALLDIEFQTLGELPPLSDDFQLNIYRIIQELVNNIIKHSNASHALIQFQVRDEWLNITIDDNGTGMPEAASATGGIGLQNLHDRIGLLHGTMETERGKGTSVYLECTARL